MDHSADEYSSDFESMKKVKHLGVESDGDNNTHHRSTDEVWIKPKSERKSPTEGTHFGGRLSVTTTHSGQHLSDGAASSSEMSPGSSSPSRSCTQCGATKTPLWRNGPCGPKSLCNACGIRYKKVGCTKRTFNGGSGEAQEPAVQPAAKPSTKSPKRKAEEVIAPPTERTHHRKSKVVIRESNTSYSSNPASNSNSSNNNTNTNSNNNNNNSNNNNNNNNNSSSSNKRESGVEEKVTSMVFRRVAVPRRVCTRRSLPAFQQQSQKWGSRSARLYRKSQSKDEEEEGAALLMALACGLVNA